jgi:hypothetical protein
MLEPQLGTAPKHHGKLLPVAAQSLEIGAAKKGALWANAYFGHEGPARPRTVARSRPGWHGDRMFLSSFLFLFWTIQSLKYERRAEIGFGFLFYFLV